MLTQYDPCPGRTPATSTPGWRALDSEGVQGAGLPELGPGLFGWPDQEVRELCFRIYNEHIAEVQERSGGRDLRRRPHQLVGREGPGGRSTS